MSEIVDTEVLDAGFLQCRLPMSRVEFLSAQRSTLRCCEDQGIGIGIGATEEVLGNAVAEEGREHYYGPYLVGLRWPKVKPSPDLRERLGHVKT